MALVDVPASFLTLPYELRDLIYKTCLPLGAFEVKCVYHDRVPRNYLETGHFYAYNRLPVADGPAGSKKRQTFAALARTCRMVNQEVTALAYQEVVFILHKGAPYPTNRVNNVDMTFRCMQRVDFSLTLPRTREHDGRKNRFRKVIGFDIQLRREASGVWKAEWDARCSAAWSFGRYRSASLTEKEMEPECRYAQLKVYDWAPRAIMSMLGSSNMSYDSIKSVYRIIVSMFWEAAEVGSSGDQWQGMNIEPAGLEALLAIRVQGRGKRRKSFSRVKRDPDIRDM